MTVRRLGVTLILIAMAGCSLPSRDGVAPDSAATGSADSTSTAPGLCAAIRGNGQLIYAHFGGLARLSETYGPLAGVGGGSSGSISTFIYESMHRSPFVRTDGALDAGSGKKIALLLKSLMGVVDNAQTTSGVDASAQAIDAYRLTAAVLSDDEGITQAERTARLVELIDLVQSEADALNRARGQAGTEPISILAKILRKEPFERLATAPPDDKQAAAREIYASLAQVGSFDASDARVFFREGIIDFEGLAEVIGRVADFYAGYGAKQGDWAPAMQRFVDQCSDPAVGKDWRMLVDEHPTCGQLFDEARLRYRNMLETTPSRRLRHRIDDVVGEGGPDPFIAVATTSYFHRDSGLYRNYATALQAFRRDTSKPIDPEVFGNGVNALYFAEGLRFAYWVPRSRVPELQRLTERRAAAGSLKARKRDLLSGRPWRQVLTTSPAEPSLAPVTPFSGDDSRLSTGGWNDLQPVQIMRDAGCSQVVYLTRLQPEGGSPFVNSAIKQLGASEADKAALYALGPGSQSGFNEALQEAAFVFCTDWDSFDVGDPDFFASIFRHVYIDNYAQRPVGYAPGRAALASRLSPPLAITPRHELAVRGCTPGT